MSGKRRLPVSWEFIVGMCKDDRSWRIDHDPLPDDARLVGVVCDELTHVFDLVIESDAWVPIEDGGFIPRLEKMPVFRAEPLGA